LRILDEEGNVIRLNDNLSSGNGYKARLLPAQLGVPFERVEYDIDRTETRTPEFLRINLAFDSRRKRPSSISKIGTRPLVLFYLAEGTLFLPDERFGRAQVLRWSFFEQYSHEPNISSPRYWITHNLSMTEERRLTIEPNRGLGYAALGVMEGHLKVLEFFVENRYSIGVKAC
jgi:glutathione S-transferase